MLRQNQAKLLSDVYAIVGRNLGALAAESWLLCISEAECHTRHQLNDFFLTYLDDDASSRSYLNDKSHYDHWLNDIDLIVMNDVKSKYNEVKEWLIIEKPLPKRQ